VNPEYRVVWATAAENDLKEIIEYIAAESPDNAINVLSKIREHASNLYSLPARGRIVPELQDQGIPLYRELVISPWRLIYRIADLEVYVVSVIDSRRNVEDILLHKLIRKR